LNTNKQIERMSTRISYFINQYPKVSHSFIRREILALERQGFEVQRIALRGWDDAVTDSEDVLEKSRTRYVLQGGLLSLLLATLRTAMVNPGRFVSALALALKMGRHADRPRLYHLMYLAEACHILPWLQQFGSQHVHAHFGTNSTEVVMLANALGAPGYSFTVHGPEEFDKPQFIGLGPKIERSRFVVAISSYGRSQLYRWVAHTQWHKVQVVHCGLEASFHSVPPSSPPDLPRLVCVGRLCEQKGQLLLVQAMALLAQRGVVWELVLAGDGEMRPDIEALVAQHGLQAQVRITGWISSAQVRTEILAARALVLPSFAEGLPVVIMEAMALRRPVLTTAIAGIPELVRSGESGWLFAAGDVDALADAIANCLATPVPLLAHMGDQAHHRVLQRHCIDIEAAKLAEHFKFALQQEPV
jgi:glycosyltransferase involved in cell wall biosynthesis